MAQRLWAEKKTQAWESSTNTNTGGLRNPNSFSFLIYFKWPFSPLDPLSPLTWISAYLFNPSLSPLRLKTMAEPFLVASERTSLLPIFQTAI